MSLVEKMTIATKVVFKALAGEEKQLTLHDKIDKFNYLQLKSMNKLYASSARSIREAAIKNKGAVRGHLRFLRNKEGQEARLFHVALCFLKGKKYSEVEPNVEKKNKLNSKQLINLLTYRVSRAYYTQLNNEITKFLES